MDILFLQVGILLIMEILFLILILVIENDGFYYLFIKL